MSKLDEILHPSRINLESVNIGGSPHTQKMVLDPDMKTETKILILDLLAESLKESDGDVGKLADRFTEKVKGL